MVARLLVLLLLAQPVYVALGMELESASETVEETSDTSPTPSMEGASSVEHENEEMDDGMSHADTSVSSVPLEEGEQDASDGASSVSPTTDVNAAHEDTSVADGTPFNGAIGGNEDAIDDGVIPDGSQDVEGADDSNASSGEQEDSGTASEELLGGTDTGGSTAVPAEEVASSTNMLDIGDETSSTSVASTTDDAFPAQVNDLGTTTAHNASNRYVFGEGECTLVAEGEFYCIAGGPERQVAEDPRVYTERDREGDREIYYFDGVTVRRITNNSYDDFAAVFDEETQRIVWQANIADRMQIMLYDLPTNTTRQVTTGRTNSSNPDIRGDTIVWQEWVDTNWEVMLAKVHGIGEEFELERLTDNAVHDLFPQVYDNIVTWQSERGRSWEIVVYDLATKKRTMLEKREDTKYENPRFALLFDSRHENGDVETIGYTLDTGEMMELGTQSTPRPIIPITPKEKVPDVPVQEGTSTMQLKVNSRNDEGEVGTV